ncbi:MAG: hypothetical protein ACUVTP_09500 [Candidatus Fervidibacter sp.]|uniref:hypothetical protein n=1 Tax=Candidatus Fervidibacter sp. TaxID=3100871 RepID=UPI00404B9978
MKSDGAKSLSQPLALGAYKDTMPRREWFRFVGSSLPAFLAGWKTKGQAQVSINAVAIPAELEAGSPESWEGSHPLSLSVWSMSSLATFSLKSLSLPSQEGALIFP